MPEFFASTDHGVLTIEHFWATSGHKKTIFIEDSDFIQKLMNSKIDLNASSRFELPFESFQLAFPKGLMVNGRKMRSMIVSSIPNEERQERYYDPFHEYHGIDTKLLVQDTQPGENCITFLVGDSEDEGEILFFNAIASDMMHVLERNDPDDLSLPEGSVYDLSSATKTKDATNFKFDCLKLLFALSVFHSATDGEYLREGLPFDEVNFKKVIDGKFDKQIKPLSLKSPQNRTERTAHHRSFHFRNLRNEKYYQNEYAKMSPGSRWVFVKDTVVGEIEAFTQESDV